MPDTRAGEGPDTVRGYDAVIVDCPGNLENTETLAGVSLAVGAGSRRLMAAGLPARGRRAFPACDKRGRI